MLIWININKSIISENRILAQLLKFVLKLYNFPQIIGHG